MGSRGTRPEIGAREGVSHSGAGLDRTDTRDRTFESAVEVLRNISPRKVPGGSRNVPGWQKVIRHLFISISIKEILLCQGEKEAQNHIPI